ncbi:hypothetical protein DPMN_036907 [Dreissena polymorpha]|uniref:Uncharacterized protein n=1 Tax=Dreissena polymorpha TaxID=45954 RepID=A0A9D4MCG3_DREPO|nr:hypothetical protein DPMN_036907 [Dreissena polymorpha]
MTSNINLRTGCDSVAKSRNEVKLSTGVVSGHAAYVYYFDHVTLLASDGFSSAFIT